MITINHLFDIEDYVWLNLVYSAAFTANMLDTVHNKKSVARFILDNRPAGLERGDDWTNYLNSLDLTKISDYFAGLHHENPLEIRG